MRGQRQERGYATSCNPTCLSALYLGPQEPSSIQLRIIVNYEPWVFHFNVGTPQTYIPTRKQPGTCKCLQNTAPCLGGCSGNIFQVF